MKSNYWFTFLMCLLLLIFSCQKELDDSRDLNAKGILVKDSTGNCSLIVASGSFITGKNLNDSNELTVTVDITTIGNYTIYTDTINGYFFKATGTFTKPGKQMVQLKGTGKPLAAGVNLLTVHFFENSCQVSVTVQPAIPLAAYILSGAPNGCTNASVAGTFIKGTALDSNFYVSITLNVNTAGTYSITTNNVNNYQFFGSGVLSSTGMQSVRLYAAGIPLSAGTDTFAITANNSTCHFTVRVIPAFDYFPLTASSYWIYNNLFSPTDSVVRTITGTTIAGGTLYSIVQEQKTYSSQQLLYKKEGVNYLDYGEVTKYTTSFAYSNSKMAGLVFLKANLSIGTSWQSPEYMDTASFGQVISLRYNYVCEDDNATVSLNGQTFSNVRKILMYPEIKAQGNVWGNTSEYYSSWYAKDIGLIYEKKINNSFTISEIAIRRWRVY